jgi:hypothetical protein
MVMALLCAHCVDGGVVSLGVGGLVQEVMVGNSVSHLARTYSMHCPCTLKTILACSHNPSEDW